MLAPDAVTADHALILDFDGTLVDLAATPSAVMVPSGLSKLLQRLHDLLDGAVAIVTGRPVAEIEGFLQLPDYMIVAGVHGAEWRGQNGIDAPDLQVQLDRLAKEAGRLFGSAAIERKSFAVAIHYRANPQQACAIENFLNEHLTDVPDLKVMAGKAVFEVKPAWANKGEAVRKLMSSSPFLGRKALMFGDDVTDEDGFRATIEQGGIAVKVGAGESVAACRLETPDQVHAWLKAVSHNLTSHFPERSHT